MARYVSSSRHLPCPLISNLTDTKTVLHDQIAALRLWTGRRGNGRCQGS